MVLDITLIFKFEKLILHSLNLEGPISIEKPIKRFTGPNIDAGPIVPWITKAYYQSLTSTFSKIWILKDICASPCVLSSRVECWYVLVNNK